MEEKIEYVVRWQFDQYWAGVGRIGDKQQAEKFTKDEFPSMIQDRRLYKPREDPTSWFYMSMCGRTAYVEKA